MANNVSGSIREKLKYLSPSLSECCIFRVHKQLRGVNEKAYEPEIVAIGPYHHGNNSLQSMEKHKLHYLKFLLERRNKNDEEKNADLESFVNALQSLEQEARDCYAEPITPTAANGFIEMMLVDGCFIIEVIRKFKRVDLREKNDPIFRENFSFNSLQRDLMLFENQIPFFILCKLFDMIVAPNQHNRLIHLVLEFFGGLFPSPGHREQQESRNTDYKHLLQLIHDNWLPSFAGKVHDQNGSNKKGEPRIIPNITKLQEAGVKLEKVEGYCSMFDIKFQSGVMQVPPLTIDDRTESLLRNLIAYEQYCPHNHFSFVTDYARFMDYLIDSPKDVQILCGHGIVNNLLSSDEVISVIFNKISDGVTEPSEHFYYADTFKKVNIHCSKRRNRWMAYLRSNYLNTPWGVISVFAACFLLVLTLTRTLFTIFPRKN